MDGLVNRGYTILSIDLPNGTVVGVASTPSDFATADQINALLATPGQQAEALRLLSELPLGTTVKLEVPEGASAFLPAAQYSFEVGASNEWQIPFQIRAQAVEYQDALDTGTMAVTSLARIAQGNDTDTGGNNQLPVVNSEAAKFVLAHNIDSKAAAHMSNPLNGGDMTFTNPNDITESVTLP
ncbi:MAG: hypothetical protein ACYDEQ_12115, partial [Desulfocucumaceae bacterium]